MPATRKHRSAFTIFYNLKDFMKQMFYRSKKNLRYKNNPESQNNMLLSIRSFLLT